MQWPLLLVSLLARGAVGKCNVEREDGASSRYCVQNQRVGADLLEAARATHDPSLEALARAMLTGAFVRSLASGAPIFEQDDDRYHSLSFFAEALARAMLLDPALGRDTFARDLLTRMANPETNTKERRAGFDVNYQSAGMAFAARVYASTYNRSLRCGLKEMLKRSGERLLRAVEPETFRVRGADSTRTCHEYSNNGVFKKPEEKLVVTALAYAGAITAEQRFIDTADALSARVGWARGAHQSLGTCDR